MGSIVPENINEFSMITAFICSASIHFVKTRYHDKFLVLEENIHYSLEKCWVDFKPALEDTAYQNASY